MLKVDEKNLYKQRFKFIDKYLDLFKSGRLKEFKLLKNIVFEKINKIKECPIEYPPRSYYDEVENKDRIPQKLEKYWSVNKPVILYLYLPFCKNACSYCDYTTIQVKNLSFAEEYLQYYKRELALYKKVLKQKKISHLYIFGGTPTVLADKQLEDFLAYIRDSFGPYLSKPWDQIEYLCEVSPGTLTERKIKILKNFNIKTLSIGVQTLNEKILKNINRAQTKNEVLELIPKVINDFKVTIDLIAGLPGSNKQILEDDITTLLKFKPHNFTIFSLYVYERSELGKSKYYISPKELGQYYDSANKILLKNGYNQATYEEYVRVDEDLCDYLDYSYLNDGLTFGTGLADLSYSGNFWYSITDDYEEYKGLIDQGLLPIDKVLKLTDKQIKIKHLIFSLRCLALDKKKYKLKFKEPVEKEFKLEINALEYLDFIKNKKDKLELTYQGQRHYELIMQFFMRL